jgi:hypothetical protein
MRGIHLSTTGLFSAWKYRTRCVHKKEFAAAFAQPPEVLFSKGGRLSHPTWHYAAPSMTLHQATKEGLAADWVHTYLRASRITNLSTHQQNFGLGSVAISLKIGSRL